VGKIEELNVLAMRLIGGWFGFLFFFCRVGHELAFDR